MEVASGVSINFLKGTITLLGIWGVPWAKSLGGGQVNICITLVRVALLL